MKILIADPADARAKDLFRQNSIEFDDRPDISALELLNTISSYDGLMVRSRTKVTREVLLAGNILKAVGRIGSGFDNIDVEVCRRKGIAVVNAPDANSIAVAELTVGLMIASLRKLPLAFESMKAGLWIKDELWGAELHGKTVGIVGYGYVGSKVDRLVSAFGATTLIYSRSQQTATLPEIFERSDIVTVHLGLNESTKGIVNSDLLGLLKPGAILVNISRGQILDEQALLAILTGKKIRGAVLDVYTQEPLAADSLFRKLDNVILTPHIGAATVEALSRASMTVAEDIISVLQGRKPKYRVV